MRLPRENVRGEDRGPTDSFKHEKITNLFKSFKTKVIKIYLRVSCLGEKNLLPSVPFNYFKIEFQYM